MASLNGYAKRVATLREAMEATLETWNEQLETLPDDSRKRETLEDRIYKLEEAISTLESLESDLES